ncbi:hypothetical protein VTH06DRAFT_4759 [Thermothelomyces fergusii]
MGDRNYHFFTYLDFITSKFSKFGDYQDVMGNVADEGQKERLRATFQRLALMRRVGDELMGRPILQIPKCHPTELITVEFSPLEATGAECYHHNPDQFRELARKYAITVTPRDEKRIKRVRKPGDDEFGLQPRLTRGRKTNKGGKRKKKARSRVKRSPQGAGSRKNNGIEQIRTNAGVFLKGCDAKPWDPVPHSAKTRAAMDLITKWQGEAPDDKIIVFVQWIPMLSFLGRMLFQNGFRFVYLWGEMETDEQERCIRAFEDMAEIKVMLISVTCGAHGLNLTVANRAIVFDHWWHEGWERQAFARIHRIGQTKEVYTAKLVVKGSMDETVMAIQASKKEAIGAAVGGRNIGAGGQDTSDELSEDGSYVERVLGLDRMRTIFGEEGSESDGVAETTTEAESCSDDDDDDDSDEEDGRGSDAGTTPSGSDGEVCSFVYRNPPE